MVPVMLFFHLKRKWNKYRGNNLSEFLSCDYNRNEEVDKMKKAILFLGNGYEEIEALTVVDFLRRAEIIVDMVSITGDLETVSAHGVHIKADKLVEEVNPADYDAV